MNKKNQNTFIFLFLILPLMTFVTTNTWAIEYNFMLESRADFVNSHKKTTNSSRHESKERFNNFSNGMIKLSLFGPLNESLSYRFRYRFLATAANPSAAGARESINTNNGIDHLFIDHIVGSYRTRMGKQNWSEAFGRESFLNGTDIFLSTLAAGNYKAGFGSDYRYGVSFIHKVDDLHQFTLAISNPNTTFSDSAGDSTKNLSLAYAGFYSGDFWDGLFQPVLAYSLAPQEGDADHATAKTKKGNYALMAGGFRTQLGLFTLDADYKFFKKANRNGPGTTDFPLEKTKSYYLNAALEIGEFSPMLIFIADKFQSENTTANKKLSSVALGAAWTPHADLKFKYHLVLSSATTKPDGSKSTVSKVQDRKVLVGFRVDV